VTTEPFADRALAVLSADGASGISSAAEHVAAKPGLYAIQGDGAKLREPELEPGHTSGPTAALTWKGELGLPSGDLNISLGEGLSHARQYGSDWPRCGATRSVCGGY
jgi:hypothetical protein